MLSPAQLAPYLAFSPELDGDHPAVAALARELAADQPPARLLIERCFVWVRDQISHCVDAGREEVPVSASETLLQGTGFCYAKSHLLAALLRANQLPCSLVYQRLTWSGEAAPFCLHGLNAVYLPELGWYRLDARGNSKPGVYAQFSPPLEQLAYPVQYPGECLYPGVYAQPWPELVRQLRACASVSAYRAAPIDCFPPAKSDL
ncbi:transglutaminase-like domain-containing protein [Chitinibacter tainanensis]|uniref:transglutaminase-like domain-containing protein n=1 Tax=Chitinibacter tainanensis TaxID=230667 RepID=UPI0003F64F19|nr:transglutaminase family protein [Chitinibacter tainanensis]